jgi:hypothetical protein
MPGNTAHEYEVRESVNHVVDASRKLLDTDERPVGRDQHPKQHGCVRARFIVGKDLGDTYGQGLFQHAQVYDAWIRLSNGKHRDDRKPDAHGMAVKLMGVEGQKVLASEMDATTHDFVMVDNPTFFIRDAVEYGRYSDVLLKAAGKLPSSLYNALGFFLSGPVQGLLTLALLSVFQWRLPTFLRLIRFASKRIANPVTTRYWSATPYKFGNTCMKFSAVPAEFAGRSPAEGPVDDSYDALADFLRLAVAARPATKRMKGESPDYLREELARTLDARGAVFLFQVQLYRDEKLTPIEDPTVEWPEAAAPFQTVARIWIPKQQFDTPGRMAFGENLSFTPWHAIPAHEPQGEINSMRKDVYLKLSAVRHSLNEVEPREPNPDDPDPADSPPRWGADSSAFYRVLRDELDLIRQRRRHVEVPSADSGDGRHERAELANPAARDVDSLTRETRLRALNEHTVGLALAGEGVRGAAFAVGFLQGLASLSILRRLDYLSAISGGGYAAGWLAAWLKRAGGDLENVERQLAPSRIDQARATRQFLATNEAVDEEPEPLRHLRAYMSPDYSRAGICSDDAKTMILSWTRNVLIQLLVLVPLLVLIVAGARLIVALYGLLDRLTEVDALVAQFDSRLAVPIFVMGVLALGLMFLAGAVALGLALSSIARSLHGFRGADSRLRTAREPTDPLVVVNRQIVGRVLTAALLFSLCLPPIWLGLAELLGNLSFGPDTGSLFSVRMIVDAVLGYYTLLSWLNFLVHALIGGSVLALLTTRSSADVEAPRRKKFRGSSFAAGVSGGLLIVLLEWLFRECAQLGRLELVAALVPPLALLILVAALVVEAAVSGRAASDADRAWSAAVSALATIRAIYWITGMAAILYLPGVVFAAGGMARAAIAMGWLGAGAIGVLMGRHAPPKRQSARAGWPTWLASVAAQVFFVGLLGATALPVSLLANMPSLTAPGGDDAGPFAYYLRGIEGTSILTLVVIAIGAGVLHALARRLVDVNLFSLSALDAARLTRSHLGASRPNAAWRERWSQPRDQRASAGAPSLAGDARERVLPTREPDPLTGFDPGDDVELRALLIGRTSDNDRAYWGPHLLFNTTLGRAEIGGRSCDRESFLLSPLYCGSQSVGYAKTENSRPAAAIDPNLTLGRALAISGAPGITCMGSLCPSLLTALLTLFSARPGSWIEKPRSDGWVAASPRFGDLPVTASLGLAGGGEEFVYVSGGEDFERLGVYELIRRRCRYIVAVDAGDRGGASDAPLATLIRRCRIEFGVNIEIDRPRRRTGADRISSARVAIGQIHYGDVDHGAMPGVIVYVRPSLSDDEPPHIHHYAQDEASGKGQFECYRSLGEDAARVVFGDVVMRLGAEISDLARQPHAEFAPRLFAAIVEHWRMTVQADNEGISSSVNTAGTGPDAEGRHRS